MVAHGTTTIVLDLGPGVFGALTGAIDLDEIDAVVISHQHVDHCTDLFALFHTWRYGPRPRSGVPVFAPSAVFERALAFLDRPYGDDALGDVFSPDPVVGGDERSVGGLNLRFADMDHSVPTVGVRISSEHRSIFYTGDTGPGGDWVEAAADCTLMLSEASYLGDPDRYGYRQHLTAGQAGSLARQARAQRLMLTHIPPHVDVTASVAEAETTFDRPVAVAVPGVTSEV